MSGNKMQLLPADFSQPDAEHDRLLDHPEPVMSASGGSNGRQSAVQPWDSGPGQDLEGHVAAQCAEHVDHLSQAKTSEGREDSSNDHAEAGAAPSPTRPEVPGTDTSECNSDRHPQTAGPSEHCHMHRTSGVLEMDEARQTASHEPPSMHSAAVTAAGWAALRSAEAPDTYVMQGKAMQVCSSDTGTQSSALDHSVSSAAAKLGTSISAQHRPAQEDGSAMPGQISGAPSQYHQAAESIDSPPPSPGNALEGPPRALKEPAGGTKTSASPLRPQSNFEGPARTCKEAAPPAAEYSESPMRPGNAVGLPSRAPLAAEHLESSLRPGDALGLPSRAPSAAEFSESPLRPGDALEGPARAALVEVQRQKEGRQKAAAALWKQMQDLSLQTNAMLLGAMHPSPPRPKSPHPSHQSVPSGSPPTSSNDGHEAAAGISTGSMFPHASRTIPVAHAEQPAPGTQRSDYPPDCRVAVVAERTWSRGNAQRSKTLQLDDPSYGSHAAANSQGPSGSSAIEAGGLSSLAQAGVLSGAAHAGGSPGLADRPAPWPLPESAAAMARQGACQPQSSAAEHSGVHDGPMQGLRTSQQGRSVSLGGRKGSGEASQGNGPRGKENRALHSNVGGKAPSANAAKGAARSSIRWVHWMSSFATQAAQTALLMWTHQIALLWTNSKAVLCLLVFEGREECQFGTGVTDMLTFVQRPLILAGDQQTSADVMHLQWVGGSGFDAIEVDVYSQSALSVADLMVDPTPTATQ